MAGRPEKNSARFRHALSTVYASDTRSGSREFQASSAARAFCAAVSRVNGGNGGRPFTAPSIRRESELLTELDSDQTRPGHDGVRDTSADVDGALGVGVEPLALVEKVLHEQLRPPLVLADAERQVHQGVSVRVAKHVVFDL